MCSDHYEPYYIRGPNVPASGSIAVYNQGEDRGNAESYNIAVDRVKERRLRRDDERMIFKKYLIMKAFVWYLDIGTDVWQLYEHFTELIKRQDAGGKDTLWKGDTTLLGLWLGGIGVMLANPLILAAIAYLSLLCGDSAKSCAVRVICWICITVAFPFVGICIYLFFFGVYFLVYLLNPILQLSFHFCCRGKHSDSIWAKYFDIIAHVEPIVESLPQFCITIAFMVLIKDTSWSGILSAIASAVSFVYSMVAFVRRWDSTYADGALGGLELCCQSLGCCA